MIVPCDTEYLRAINPGRILGIDFGEKRIGLAISDPFQMMSSTLATVQNKSTAASVAQISYLIQPHTICAVVIGRPLHLSGRQSPMSQKAEEFAQAFAEAKTDAPVFLWDERWTTTSAEKLLIETGQSPSHNRHKIDQIAAAYLLQSFLDRLDFIKRSHK
jgi:putative holliday junction resolvase